MTVTIEAIKSAASRIKPYIHHTPILTCKTLNKITQATLFFKCENFQKVGAFKIRGATNAVSLLSADEAKQGVATHSSGNHAQALALAAKNRGIKAYIVMPNNSALVKKQAVLAYGATVIPCEPTEKSREETLQKVIEETGAVFIAPYDDERIIAGQGTAAMELILDCEPLDMVIAPVGGGGLLAGTAIAVTELSPKTQVIGAEPEGANDTYLSFKKRERIPAINPKTICDGLRTSVGKITFPIILDRVSAIFTAKEESIILATKYIWERMKIVVEPSAAVTLAIILENPEYFRDKKIGLILSGGNADIKQLAALF